MLRRTGAVGAARAPQAGGRARESKYHRQRVCGKSPHVTADRHVLQLGRASASHHQPFLRTAQSYETFAKYKLSGAPRARAHAHALKHTGPG